MTGGRKDLTLIGALVSETRAELVRAGGCPLDRDSWKRAMGDRIASRSQPEQLKDGVLQLTVVNSVWAQELSLLSTTIVERLQHLGYIVERIRCRVGRLDVDSAPQARKLPVVTAPPVELPAELAQHLERIDDADLKATIESAARSQLQLQAQRRASLASSKARRRK